MFSPAPKKSSVVRHRDSLAGYGGPPSPATPVSVSRHSSLVTPMPARPATGTPAPWSSRLSTVARTPSVKKTEKNSGADHVQPVFVGDFPQQVRNAQAEWLKALGADNSRISGGMDRRTGLSWMLCGSQLFVWSYLSGNTPQGCVALEIPSKVCSHEEHGVSSAHGNSWIVCVIGWEEEMHASTGNIVNACNSAGILMCNQQSLAVVYWPDVFSECGNIPVTSLPFDDKPDVSDVMPEERPGIGRRSSSMWAGSGRICESNVVNSMVASPVPGSTSHECIAIACRSNAELWWFECTSNVICHQRVAEGRDIVTMQGGESGNSLLKKTYTRSIIWRWSHVVLEECRRQFFLLTDHEIQCWNAELRAGGGVSKVWSYEIVSTDVDAEIKKDLAGQKHVWLLDMQVDDSGKELTVLIASFCKDRISSSSYTQYSLLTLHYKSTGQKIGEGSESTSEKVLERKAPVQVILPKARVEKEDFLFSMRLRLGGKPAGSTMILSGDGTATVTHYWNEATRLYQFDLPWDAGKVIDASVVPSLEESEEGAWVVLTEKAGVWAIPEKAVVLGGVEPPERSLSRKGSSNEGAAEEERRSLAFGGNFALRRASSEAWIAGENRDRAVSRAVSQRTAQDEEAEALIGRLFQNFSNSGQSEGAFEKLHRAGAFEREGEMNVFARASKAIVDTLAKHWTTSRAADIAVMAAVSSQLLEKQRRHQQFLQFLAASKCHEELHKRQRQSLQAIMGHGEKLAAMIQLRELHNASAQARPQSRLDSSNANLETSEVSGALWDLVQLVGEKARRNNVMLMDREKAEVFYSRVSELEELFSCVHQHLGYVVGRELPLRLQIERLCQISNACTTVVRTAIRYRDVQHSWYPSPEGLTPWYCQPTVRSGIWKLASLILELKMEADASEPSMKSMLIAELEEATDIILEAYAGAITAKVEREEEYRGLQMEYWSRRDVLLNALYQHVKDVAGTAAQEAGLGIEGEGQKQKMLRRLSPSLISLARRHAGYQTLWDICSDLNDIECLRSLMHESMGLKEGRFSNFVFEQCYKNCQHAKLLRLGEEFQEELALFLQKHKDLLWLHEIFLNHFSSASNTLHSLALSQEDDITTATEENPEIGGRKVDLSLAERRRLLNLAKIAALAGGEPGFQEKVECLDADLQILTVQEELHRMGYSGDEILTPRQLVEICLKSEYRELVLRAFDVFAWTGNTFRRSNKSLLESAWLHAADLDNWAKMNQLSKEEGWSDEQNLQMLRSTALFHSSKRCYGTKCLCYEGCLQDVLPLLQEDAEIFDLKDAGTSKWSVETILMQHQDFPEAGQLMLTAVRLGKCFGASLDTGDNGLMLE
eukprot:Gb_30615 [translate_table: standard]